MRGGRGSEVRKRGHQVVTKCVTTGWGGKGGVVRTGGGGGCVWGGGGGGMGREGGGGGMLVGIASGNLVGSIDEGLGKADR